MDFEKFINEAVHDFFKQQSFYKSAKNYQPELKKQIIDFLRRKGIKGYAGGWSSDDLTYDKLKDLSAKERNNLFRKLHKNFDVDKEFFAAKSGYSNSFSFPTFFYNDLAISIKIASNSTFYDDGHDLEIEVYPTNTDEEYPKHKTYKYKLNLLRDIQVVLNDLWSKVEDAIKRHNSQEVDDATREREERYASYSKRPVSEIERTVKTILDRYFKEYKSGRVKEIEDMDKKPVNWGVYFEKSDKQYRSLSSEAYPNFILNFDITKTNRAMKKSGSSYRSNYTIDPKIKERYPDIQKWIDTVATAIREKNDKRFMRLDFESLFGERILNDDHIKYWNRLKEYVIPKFLKLGYYPDNSMTPYKKGERTKITFTHSSEVAEKAQDPSFIKKFLQSERFNKNVKNAFFYDSFHPDDIQPTLIRSLFER